MRVLIALSGFALVSALLLQGFLTALADADWNRLGRAAQEATDLRPVYKPSSGTGPIAYTHPRSVKKRIDAVTNAACAGAAVLLAPPSTALQPYRAEPIRVIDGDTFVARREQGKVIIRLWGLDAPEKTQRFGSIAKEKLELILNLRQPRPWTILPVGQDLYERTVAIVIPSNGGITANALMVRYGLAYHNPYYAPADSCLSISEVQARQERKHIWREDNKEQLRPWDYRLEQGEVQ